MLLHTKDLVSLIYKHLEIQIDLNPKPVNGVWKMTRAIEGSWENYSKKKCVKGLNISSFFIIWTYIKNWKVLLKNYPRLVNEGCILPPISDLTQLKDCVFLCLQEGEKSNELAIFLNGVRIVHNTHTEQEMIDFLKKSCEKLPLGAFKDLTYKTSA